MAMRIGGVTGTLVLAMLLPMAANSQWKTRWEYQGPLGPDHWADLDADYAICKSGKQQSPVDIDNPQKADLPALRFESHSRPLKGLTNNGYTIRVNYHDAPGSGDSMWVGAERYQLIQFHFHRPSEETIHGRASAMVAHLMYKGDGGVIGVAVLLNPGRPNSTVQKLWDHMPMTESTVKADYSHEEQEVPGVSIDPGGLLPKTLGYYTYLGSVTAPPCTEGVTWYVLKTSVEISAAQIEAFAKLYPRDVRQAQPLNGRIIKESR